jgi:hypothetical protein
MQDSSGRGHTATKLAGGTFATRSGVPVYDGSVRDLRHALLIELCRVMPPRSILPPALVQEGLMSSS